VPFGIGVRYAGVVGDRATGMPRIALVGGQPVAGVGIRAAAWMVLPLSCRPGMLDAAAKVGSHPATRPRGGSTRRAGIDESP